MTIPNFKILAFMSALLFGYSAFAGGSLSTSEIFAETDANLLKTINVNFTISSVALGMRIGGQVAPDLGGARVGPYIICAKPIGAASPYTLSLVFNTDTRFLNARGHQVELGPKAVKIVERVTDVQIVPAADFCSSASL